MVGRVLLAFVTLLIASPALGWWDGGHQITASIAFRRLRPEQRSRVVALLKAHPRWSVDFEQQMPEQVRTADAETQAEWTFQQAAIWPDLARKFEGADRERFHHSTWHYVNLPHFLTDADRKALNGKVNTNTNLIPPDEPAQDMNIVQTIRIARRIVGDGTASAESRGIMLPWLFHTVGDIHQPLHSTALFSQRLLREGCRGGNLIKTKQRDNLHALWDSLPGEHSSVREAGNRAIALMNRTDLKLEGERAAGKLDELTWLTESHELTIAAVYDTEVLAVLRAAESEGARELPAITLPEDYLKTAGAIAERRVVEAGTGSEPCWRKSRSDSNCIPRELAEAGLEPTRGLLPSGF